jgi:hypothetical protein
MAQRIIVTAAGLLLLVGVNWYFLISGRKKAGRR